MANAGHSEHKYELTPFERFEQLTSSLLKVTKVEAEDISNQEKEDKRDAQKGPHQ